VDVLSEAKEMKHLLLTTIAAVLVVGCGESQSPEWPDNSIGSAARKGNIKAIKQHLAAGADVNAKYADGSTPLHFAAVVGRREVVELLIAEGADVNGKGVGGGTPLHYAALGGRKEVAELLIAKGADVNAKRSDGSTPLDRAIRLGQTETAAFLRKHGGKTGEELEAEGK
jgi:cytohesin